jgi:hypothetical protein
MSQVLNLVHDLENQISDTVAALPYVGPDILGLDRRSAYRVWIDVDAVIVRKKDDSTLRYYGGFEYVDRDSRIECGDYVIYTDDDSRVANCLDNYNDAIEQA